MELIGSILLIAAVTLVVGLFIARPFLLGESTPEESLSRDAAQEREHTRSSLLAERDRILTALQELDFDYALGKVPPEEYPAQRDALRKTGADVLRRLDEMQASGAGPAEGQAEDRIEAAVAARRADAARIGAKGDGARVETKVPASRAVASGTNGKSKDELEDIIASRKRSRKEASAGFCPHCGKPVQKSDKFCSKCGATL